MEEPISWQHSLSSLQELLSEASNSKIEKACSTILELHNSGGEGHILPEDVKRVVHTIRLRALIGAGRYADVHSITSAVGLPTNEENVLEGAYALYRTKKYQACRDLCVGYLENYCSSNDAGASRVHRGMQHICAQTLYRMGETREANTIYSKLLAAGEMDADEKEDVLANALANKSANYTPGSLLSDKDEKAWIENVDEIANLLNSYGVDSEDGEMLQNYDLAYNLATYLLISSDARPRSSIINAKRLLQHAEKSALTVLESNSEEDAVSSEKREQAKLLAEKEALPIKVNLACANLLLGGEENEKEALRTFLTVVMEGKKKNSSGGVEANLVAAASNNLAILRDGKESVFDVLKRIPTATSCSVSDDAVKGKAGVSSVPLLGATPQQVRTVLFNRALHLAKMGNSGGCLEILAVLRASLDVSYRGDESEGKSTPGSPKSRGKKKKGMNKPESSDVSEKDVPTAKPASDVETIAWSARADWVESELLRVVALEDKKPEDIINDAISKVDIALKESCDEASSVLAFTKAQLLLQAAATANGQSKPRLFIESLEALPPLVRDCPGTTVTLAALHGALNKDQSTSRSVDIMSTLGEDIPARLAMSQFHLENNRYDDAIKLLEGILDEENAASTHQLMSATALLVRALSYTDPEKANDYAETLRDAYGESEVDGEELESMEIPRFAKKAGETAASTSKVRKMIASSGRERSATNRGQGNKKNREAILRKRAKQRETYLKELESKGLYDPNKTPQTKPDPERWIPKSQRSYNRRGRRGRYNSNIGAQGGGAGAGMEKDSQKLDVAARVAAAKSGAANGMSKSTANMQVSGSGQTRKGKKRR